MNELLLAVKTELRTLSGVRGRDVFITPHVNFIPTGVRQPCIGIKDGKVVRNELAGGMVEETLFVDCVAMVKVRRDGITGDAGVLALVKRIEAVLDQNTLGLAGMEYAWSLSDTASKMFSSDNKQWLMQKIITFQYTRERER
jgi:hypothetical protein